MSRKYVERYGLDQVDSSLCCIGSLWKHHQQSNFLLRLEGHRIESRLCVPLAPALVMTTLAFDIWDCQHLLRLLGPVPSNNALRFSRNMQLDESSNRERKQGTPHDMLTSVLDAPVDWRIKSTCLWAIVSGSEFSATTSEVKHKKIESMADEKAFLFLACDGQTCRPAASMRQLKHSHAHLGNKRSRRGSQSVSKVDPPPMPLPVQIKFNACSQPTAVESYTGRCSRCRRRRKVRSLLLDRIFRRD